MSESEGKRGRRPSSRSRKAEKPKPRRWALLKKYKAEAFGALLLLLGVFLLVEKLEIRAAIYAKFVWLTSAASDLFSTVIGWGSGIEFSDLVGITLVFGGAFLLAQRIRSRMIGRGASHASTDKCPRCGEDMKRAPRKMGHQFVGLLLYVHIKRYSCGKCPGRITLWASKRVARNWQQ